LNSLFFLSPLHNFLLAQSKTKGPVFNDNLLTVYTQHKVTPAWTWRWWRLHWSMYL